MLAGSLGTLFRYLLSIGYKNIPFTNSISFINGISIINIIGSLLFAIIYGLFIKNQLDKNLQILVLTGFLGAFTTFSTLIFESRQLYVENPLNALFYLLIQVIISFIIVHISLNHFDL